MGRSRNAHEIELPPATKPTLSVLEASAVSGLSRSTIYSLVKDRTIPSKRVRKRWLIRRIDLEKYLQPDQM